jgi:Rrf2 family nitric oxide-sensitive transcriptional repressor
MQLNVTTNYGVRIVLYLASKRNFANSNEISKEMGIPHTYILKLTKVLKGAGILTEKRGVNGGFALEEDSETLTLLTVLETFEKTMVINRCLEDEYCSRNATPYCNVRKHLAKVQEELGNMLNVKISTFL